MKIVAIGIPAKDLRQLVGQQAASCMGNLLTNKPGGDGARNRRHGSRRQEYRLAWPGQARMQTRQENRLLGKNAGQARWPTVGGWFPDLCYCQQPVFAKSGKSLVLYSIVLRRTLQLPQCTVRVGKIIRCRTSQLYWVGTGREGGREGANFDLTWTCPEPE